ncbi:hypothetical protein SynNOUM97013_01294 [Synechococcus sp. NOUM97013]|nr:hypothetical protein SynNOUM97013_01294 [Synechococcus sp. NOUM97013]
MSSRLLSRFLLRVATALDTPSIQCCFDRKAGRQIRQQNRTQQW